MKVTNKQVVINVMWRYAERILAQLVSFVVSIVLARLVLPEEYGTVALIMALITIVDAITTRGFPQALVQKREVDHLDYSTVFITNMGIALILYGVLYISSPVISQFYNIDGLTLYIRVLSIRVIFSGFNSVQQAYVQREMIFRKFFWSTLIGTVLSGVVGIVMAYADMGIWALIAQSLLNTIVDTLVLFFTIDLRVRLEYSLARLKKMFNFGITTLGKSLLESLYNELRSLVLGKYYSSSSLAFHNRGEQIPKLIVSNIQISAGSVMFSALSREDTDKEVVQKMRSYLGIMFFIIAPILVGLASTAEAIIAILFGTEWNGAVVYMVIYCFVYMNWIVQIPYLQALNARGMSDVTLILSVLHRIVGVTMLVLLVIKGPVYIAVSALIADIFATIICIVAVAKKLNYKVQMLFEDLGKTCLAIAVMGIVVCSLGNFVENEYIRLFVQIFTGVVVYILFNFAIKNKEIFRLVCLLKNMKKGVH